MDKILVYKMMLIFNNNNIDLYKYSNIKIYKYLIYKY